MINQEITDGSYTNSNPLNTGGFKSCKRRLHILIMEDYTEDEQADEEHMIMCKMLELAGHSYKTAASQSEIEKLFDQERFDIVLIMVSKEESKAFSAAKSIREKNEDISIVALTANRAQDRCDKCIESGMNYYLEKPVNFDELFSIFDQIFGEEEENLDKLIDPEQVFIKLGSDQAFFAHIVKMFATDAKKLIKDMRDALAEREANKLRVAAHTLKGSIGVFEADEAQKIAKDLEMMGYQQELENAEGKIDELENAVDIIVVAFDHFIATQHKASENMEEG